MYGKTVGQGVLPPMLFPPLPQHPLNTGGSDNILTEETNSDFQTDVNCTHVCSTSFLKLSSAKLISWGWCEDEELELL